MDKDYSLNKDIPLTSVQNEVVEFMCLNYLLIFERTPQIKKSSIRLLKQLNSISHSKVISYNFHKRDTYLMCNTHGVYYHARPERALSHSYCPLCNSLRISVNTKKAMLNSNISSKVLKENRSLEHKKRFEKNKHLGSTNVPTTTESSVMDFMLNLGFEWNKVIKTVGYNNFNKSTYYIPDFVNEDMKIIVELDGGHHNTSNQTIVDKRRESVFNLMGYSVYHFKNRYVTTHRKFFELIIKELVEGGDDLYDRLYIK